MYKKTVLLLFFLTVLALIAFAKQSEYTTINSNIERNATPSFTRSHAPAWERENLDYGGFYPRRDDDSLVYEYGFEDDWEDWETADLNGEGDFWEISDEDAHNGDHSAHCPIEENLQNVLISPLLEIPEEGWYTSFDFWVCCDMRMPDADGDGWLDDYFRVNVCPENGGWQDVIYDYCRNDDWYENWIHYRPGVWFRNDLAEWRINLNLSQWAGQSVWLRWMVITDDVMDDDQGSGIWIDDFRLIARSGYENDVGVEWMHVGYPLTIGTNTDCQVSVKNFGFTDKSSIRKFYQIDNERATPIIPWQGDLLSGESELHNFRPRSFPYPGSAILRAYTDLNDDDYRANDTVATEILIYPEGMWMLGYDDRCWSDPVVIEAGNGPAVLFTPEEDDIDGEFNIRAIEARWSNEDQDEEVITTLQIFEDQNGRLGEELYSTEISVTPDDLHPNAHYIPLFDIEEIEGIDGNFWVYFNIENEDNLPKVLGRQIGDDDLYWGEDHYYVSDGDNVQEIEYDLQIHAIITNDELEECNLVVRPDLNFGEVAIEGSRTLPLIVLGAGSEVVTIEEVEIEDGVFSIEYDGDFPIELMVGETAILNVIFSPEDEDEYSAELTFNCNDDSPPTVEITGIGSPLPDIEIEPEALDFGDVIVEMSPELEFTIRNLGLEDLIISDISALGEYFEVDFEDELIIESDGGIDIPVTFSPGEAGEFEGVVNITSNDPDEGIVTIALSGTGIETGVPVIISPIEDIELNEDFEPFRIAILDTVFIDPDDDELTFSVESDNEHLLAFIQGTNQLYLSVDPNWFGEAQVTVIADDHTDDDGRFSGLHNRSSGWHGLLVAREALSAGKETRAINSPCHPVRRDLTNEFTFTVTVNSVNDAPETFDLVLPENRTILDRLHCNVSFLWERAEDIDNEVLYYSLLFHIITDDLDTTVFCEETEDNEFTLCLDTIFVNLGMIDEDVEVFYINLIWGVTACDGELTIEASERRMICVSIPYTVDEYEKTIPEEFSLDQAYPNPFNAVVNIPYALPVSSPVSLIIYDVFGRMITSLVDNNQQSAGNHTIIWDGKSIKSGIYFIKFNAGNYCKVRKVVLVK
ncbi:MAG: choice-of-anchor D domain-containing protein [Candidatus Hatepunaea meridiana]|nr:choice-of-anchor D domain-containing protein [Candidatus Hatepunaea meridiana]